MPAITIAFGAALIAVGVGTYIGAGDDAPLSAFLLQLILGLLAVALGVGSLVKQQLRMHFMHGAVLLAAMGVIVPAVMFVLFLINDLDRAKQMELLRVLGTVLASGGYVYLAVQSFRKARRTRADGKDGTPAAAPADDPPADTAAGP